MISPIPLKSAPLVAASAVDRPRRKREPAPMTRQRLENIAGFHVERFATTAAHLKRVLQRRAERSLRVRGGDAHECIAWIEEIVARFMRNGIVNDERYASGRVATLRRMGKSPGKIRALLVAKGVDRLLIDAAIKETALTATGTDAALEAALAYARRRRLGAFGDQGGDAETRRKKATKDLSAMARAGFSYGIAKRALAAKDTD